MTLVDHLPHLTPIAEYHERDPDTGIVVSAREYAISAVEIASWNEIAIFLSAFVDRFGSRETITEFMVEVATRFRPLRVDVIGHLVVDIQITTEINP